MAGKCEQAQEIRWTTLQDDTTTKLLPKIPANTNFQLESDNNNLCKSIPDVEIPDKARDKMKELFDIKYVNMMSQTATDIGRTNLIELDITAEGPPIASKPYTVPLKYHEFVDYKIKQLEEAGIISQSMSDWASSILVVPKKEDQWRPAPKQILMLIKMVNLILEYALTIESSAAEYKQHIK